MSRLDPFWAGITAQLKELESAKSADEVVAILNRYGPPSSGHAFFADSGGDATVSEALRVAGWRDIWSEASYHWSMRAPDGSIITYVEGDIYKEEVTP